MRRRHVYRRPFDHGHRLGLSVLLIDAAWVAPAVSDPILHFLRRASYFAARRNTSIGR